MPSDQTSLSRGLVPQSLPFSVSHASTSEGPPAPTAPVPTGLVPSLRSTARQLRTAFHKNGSGEEKWRKYQVSARSALASSLGRLRAAHLQASCCRLHQHATSHMLWATRVRYLRSGLGSGLGLARCVASQVRLPSDRLDTVKRPSAPSPAFGVSLAQLRRAETIAVSCIRRRSCCGQCRTASAHASAQGRNVGFGRGVGGPMP